MQIRYQICESTGRGKGLFAAEFIPKGTIVWKHYDEDHRVYKDSISLEKDLDRYCGNNISAIQSYMSHVYCNGNAVMYYELDDGKYFNHDREKFNVKKTYSKKFEQGKESWIAIRDINENEELFINYAFDGIIDDPPWFIDLSKKYNVPIGVEFENWSNEHESKSNNNDDQNYGLSLLVKDEKLQQIEQI